MHNLTANYRERLYGEIWRVLAPPSLPIDADKYAQQGEAHREALSWQLGLFFNVLGTRGQYDLLREWVLHYVEDEAADRVMPEADASMRLELLGFANVKIVVIRSSNRSTPTRISSIRRAVSVGYDATCSAGGPVVRLGRTNRQRRPPETCVSRAP